MKQDIENRNDIEFLLEQFYEKIFKDKLIGPVFTELIPDFETHLPVIADFWESVLFSGNNYKGNPIQVHKKINEKIKLTPEHFKTWLNLWEETIDEFFIGINADNAKSRAVSIATVMQIKIGNYE